MSNPTFEHAGKPITRFYTSDLHFGHANIIKYCNRPFADVDEMNYSLIRNWNHVVAPHDEVIILGDFAMGKIDHTLPIASLLNGIKYLLPGNHDRCWLGHPEKKRRGWTERYEEAGLRVIPYNEFHTEHGVLLCHFPYEGDSHSEARYLNHRPADKGAILFHGHVHDTWKTRGRMINVGVDVWDYQPVSEEELMKEHHDT